jgi:tetratricopeptide (TPR) repeat protein
MQHFFRQPSFSRLIQPIISCKLSSKSWNGRNCGNGGNGGNGRSLKHCRNVYYLGQKKAEKGEYTQALRDYQKILTLFVNTEVKHITNAKKLLLAQAYTKSAEILSIGTSQDEKLALDYLNKALELYPDFDLSSDQMGNFLRYVRTQKNPNFFWYNKIALSNLDRAIELKRAILADNAISPKYYKR